MIILYLMFTTETLKTQRKHGMNMRSKFLQGRDSSASHWN